MEAFIAFTLAGIVLGSVYGLLAVGMTLVLLVGGTLHFAYGEIVVISMYMGWWISKMTGNPFLAFPVALVSGVVINYLLEPILRRLRERRVFLEALVLTIAVGMILSELMSHEFSGGMPIAFSSAITGGGFTLTFGLIKVAAADVYVLAGVVGTLLALGYFVYQTKQGRGLRAIAQNIDMARSLGIPVRRGATISFVLGGLLAGITAALLITGLGVASPDLGHAVTFKGLAIMLLAGMGNLKGAVIGGLILGLIECFVSGYLVGDWSDAISMGIIMIVIVLRPGGLFGAKR